MKLFVIKSLFFFIVIVSIIISKIQTQLFDTTSFTAQIVNSTQIDLKWDQTSIPTDSTTRYRINVTNVDLNGHFEWPGSFF